MHAIARTLADEIPGAGLVTLAGADHLVPMRTPGELARVLLDFLDLV
jgi:pimeloyl-ACP methyl ester carboxylesterase